MSLMNSKELAKFIFESNVNGYSTISIEQHKNLLDDILLEKTFYIKEMNEFLKKPTVSTLFAALVDTNQPKKLDQLLPDHGRFYLDVNKESFRLFIKNPLTTNSVLLLCIMKGLRFNEEFVDFIIPALEERGDDFRRIIDLFNFVKSVNKMCIYDFNEDDDIMFRMRFL